MVKLAILWVVVMIGAIVVLLTWPGRAHAHDHWMDGTPVPAWVKKACCGAGDQHLYDDENVHELKEGLKVDGYPGGIIPWSEVAPSPDGRTWVFFIMYLDGSLLKLHCVFHGYGAS